MADESQKRVDRRTRQIERRINEIYGQARVEIEDKIDEFNRGFEVRRDIHLQELAEGAITQEQYNSWLVGQMFQSQQWNAKRDQICQILHTANEQATAIVNGGTIGAFAEGANWAAYSLEHTAGVNFGFGLYDARTVTNLVINNPQILPEWRIDEPKEYVWNQRAVNNCVTQGIIQGENINQIATRIATATSNQDRNLALTHVRTSMTAAQNAGRMQRLQDAQGMGIKVVKQWMATLDGHTRDTHRDMDGETKPVGDKRHHIKFSNGCEYPGDPKGPAREVFNCRCTLVGDLEDFLDEDYQRYDNIDGVPINAMSYRQWEAKRDIEQRPVYATEQERHNVARNVIETAHRVEPQVTADLQNAVNAGTGHLEGLDYRFKSQGSLERKIRDKSLKKNTTEAVYSGQITDALRYTDISDTNHLVDDYFTITGYLAEHGYTMVEVTNTLSIVDAPYRGINTLVRTPDGYIFELQFHTPESIDIKEINHKLYEEQRRAWTSRSRYDELSEIMSENASRIPTPINIELITDIEF